jgi:hypothetical protein
VEVEAEAVAYRSIAGVDCPLVEDIPNLQRIRANIFPSAHWAITDWRRFPWHRPTRGGPPDADQMNSSQAFCISVWGTLAGPDGLAVRRVVSEMLNEPGLATALAAPGALDLTPEFYDGKLLNELGAGNPTHIDAALVLPAMFVRVGASGAVGKTPASSTSASWPTRSTSPSRSCSARSRRSPPAARPREVQTLRRQAVVCEAISSRPLFSERQPRPLP